MLHTNVIIILSLLGALALPQLATLALLVRRRKHQPIKYRGVWLLLVSGSATLVAWTWYMLFLAYEVSRSGRPEDAAGAASRGTLRQYFCGQWQWILLMANGCIMGGYFLRSFRILKIFHDHTAWRSPLSLQQQLNAEQVVVTSSTGDPMILSSASNIGMLSLGIHSRTKSRIYNERKMLVMLFFLLALLAGVKAIMDAAGMPLRYSGFGCAGSDEYGWLAVDGAEILLLLLAIWKLRAIRDDYGISTELSSVCVIFIVCTLGFLVSLLLRRSDVAHLFGGTAALSEETYLEVQASLWALRNSAIFFTSFTWPLIQSYYNSFPPLWSNCDALCSLETLLKDIVCIQYFRNYLMSVNRVEWILAWVEMELFKDLDPEGDPEALAAQARRIYDKYVARGAELEVHLSPSSVHMVTHEVVGGGGGGDGDGGAPPSIACFEEAQAELFQLMEAEFPRFLSSPSCEACLHELEKEEVLRDVLEQSGMI